MPPLVVVDEAARRRRWSRRRTRGGSRGNSRNTRSRFGGSAGEGADCRLPVVVEAAGYAVHYAVKLPQTDGSERIVLITDRRLGAWNNLWKPAGSDASSYEFSVIELRLNAKGMAEGKASLTGKIAVDTAAKTIALDNYAGLPVIFKAVKRRTS